MSFFYCLLGEMQAHLGRDAFASVLRGVLIWVRRCCARGETLLCTGRGTIERRTALADKLGARFGGITL